MIKIYGLNWEKGSGDYTLFGYFFSGNGSGKGIISQYLFYNSTGTGSGDGKGFGDNYLKGSGSSYRPFSLKEDFKK